MSVTANDRRSDVDVVVVGGGINGTGIARDAAMRGMRVALYDRNDLAFGASGNSSGMIHGGLRYLLTSPSVTRLSCLDSGFIQRIAPHLCFRIPFVFAIPMRWRHARTFLLGADALLDAYDRYQPLKGGKRHARLTAAEARSIEPGLAGDLAGAVTFDEWGIDGVRLCVANALAAREAGAEVHVHHTVEDVTREGDLYRVRVKDTLDGGVRTIFARAVMNATGAWSPRFAPRMDAEVRMRPGKGIHLVLDRRLSNYAVVAHAIDGREIFIEPWQNVSIVGTTDDDFYGDPDDVRATHDEVQYLAEGVASILPVVREARIIATTAGVRPTLYGYGPKEEDLSREHEIVDHGRGRFSFVGGKLASYRILAEEATDRLGEYLAHRRPGRTHEVALPGGEAAVDAGALASRFGVPFAAASRAAYRHGARAERVLASCAERPTDRHLLCPCEGVVEAEVRYAVRIEGARTVSDVGRRTRLGHGPCGGLECALGAAQIVGEETGRDAAWIVRDAASFLTERMIASAPAMDGNQARAEALRLMRASSF